MYKTMQNHRSMYVSVYVHVHSMHNGRQQLKPDPLITAAHRKYIYLEMRLNMCISNFYVSRNYIEIRTSFYSFCTLIKPGF